MEERKLNLNAPLLSVRRVVSTTKASSDASRRKKMEDVRLNRGLTALPSNKLDSSLDQVTEPVTVPFQWEQIPGRAKGGNLPKQRVQKDAPVTSRARPEGIFNVLKHRLEKKSAEKSVARTQINVNSTNAIVNELDSLKGRVNERAGDDSDASDDDDDDDVYSDALETLSATNSLSMNCSISSLSGPDGPIVRQSGTFAADPLTRDFMMSRFLPAAKAMALEQPHYASRKQPAAAAEQPRQVIKVAYGDRTPPITRKESTYVPCYDQCVGEKESDDEYSECDYSANISTKGCGWIPRLCFKNSLSLLNPVPGLKLKAQGSMSSTHEAEKRSKAANVRAQSPTIKKQSRDAVSKQKSGSGVLSPRLWQVDNKPTSGSNRFSYANEGQPMSRTSSPLRRSGALSPYRNDAPQSPFRGRGLLSMPKEVENFKSNKVNLYVRTVSKSQELTPHHGITRGSCPASPAVEKTLYVDSGNVAEKSRPSSGPLDIKRYMDSALRDSKNLLKGRGGMEVTSIAEFSSEDAKCEPVVESLDNKVLEHGDAVLSLLSDLSASNGYSDRVEDSRYVSKALVCITATTNENLSNDKALIPTEASSGNSQSTLVPSPLPPVLPKTPSESWLWRTLPSISSQNPFSHLYRGRSFQTKWQDTETSSTNAKWETIVKSSYSHQDHARYSQELILHASQRSNV